MSRVTSSGTYGVRTPTCTRPCSAGRYHFFRDCCCCCCRANLDLNDSSHQFRVCAGERSRSGLTGSSRACPFCYHDNYDSPGVVASDGSRGCVAYKFHRLMFNSCPWRLQRVQRQTGTAHGGRYEHRAKTNDQYGKIYRDFCKSSGTRALAGRAFVDVGEVQSMIPPMVWGSAFTP